MAVAVGLTLQAVYPPRILIAVTGLTPGDSVAVYRIVDGARTALRASQDDSVSDTSFLVVDAELPFGVPVQYVAQVSGTDYFSTTATYTLPGGKVAATDAVNALSCEVVISSWDKRARTRQSSTFQVDGRNIAVLGPLADPESDVTFFLDTDVGNEQFEQLLTNATGGVIQLRQPGGYAGIDGYYAVTDVDEIRWSQDGTDPRREWTTHLIQVAQWPTDLPAAAWTLQNIYDFYGPSGTLADLAADYATLLDIAIADWS
jgi:hypothetical protein